MAKVEFNNAPIFFHFQKIKSLDLPL